MRIQESMIYIDFLKQRELDLTNQFNNIITCSNRRLFFAETIGCERG